jgi:hypothetical protein
MAKHLHKQIRDAAVTALTGLTTTTTHVYANRFHPLTDAELPALRLYLDEEDAERLTMHANPAMARTIDLVVESCAKAASGLDDTLDQIAKEVETRLASGLTIGGQILEVLYAGMTYADDSAGLPVGVKRMRFSISFECVANAPDTLI